MTQSQVEILIFSFVGIAFLVKAYQVACELWVINWRSFPDDFPFEMSLGMRFTALCCIFIPNSGLFYFGLLYFILDRKWIVYIMKMEVYKLFAFLFTVFSLFFILILSPKQYDFVRGTKVLNRETKIVYVWSSPEPSGSITASFRGFDLSVIVIEIIISCLLSSMILVLKISYFESEKSKDRPELIMGERDFVEMDSKYIYSVSSIENRKYRVKLKFGDEKPENASPQKTISEKIAIPK